MVDKKSDKQDEESIHSGPNSFDSYNKEADSPKNKRSLQRPSLKKSSGKSNKNSTSN